LGHSLLYFFHPCFFSFLSSAPFNRLLDHTLRCPKLVSGLIFLFSGLLPSWIFLMYILPISLPLNRVTVMNLATPPPPPPAPPQLGFLRSRFELVSDFPVPPPLFPYLAQLFEFNFYSLLLDVFHFTRNLSPPFSSLKSVRFIFLL